MSEKVLDFASGCSMLDASGGWSHRFTLRGVSDNQPTVKRPARHLMKKEMHGHSRNGKQTPTYVSYISMITRCCSPNHNSYPDYGGKGITVCDRWRNSFLAFLADMGERPLGTTLDRYPDKSGNYEPGNCRWATPFQQCCNRRCSRLVTIEGRTLCLSEWAQVRGWSINTIRSRMKLGWSAERALTEPIHYFD